MTIKTKKKECAYPDCTKASVGLSLLDDGHYAPTCAEHAALLLEMREKNTKKL